MDTTVGGIGAVVVAELRAAGYMESTVGQYAKTIKALTGTKSEIAFKPLPVDDPKVRQPDISRARSMLGWEPKVSLEQGLRRTIEYFRRVVTG